MKIQPGTISANRMITNVVVASKEGKLKVVDNRDFDPLAPKQTNVGPF